ncbi:MAG TPA: ribonuclease Z [Clostridium sp.]|nr:ribonuclease Z [Clostridium sp.]
MIAIVCLDNDNGMMFNNRRQSQDRNLRKHILKLTKDSTLYMNSYSYEQFSEETDIDNIVVDEDFLNKASEKDYCFVENVSLSAYIGNIEKLILYKWNRNYPSDFKFDINVNDGWKQDFTSEFEGFSHDIITEEIYTNDKITIV